jgi:hypothetical protein
MTRRRPLTPAARRALRLEAWGHSAAGYGYADAMDVRPPAWPADAAARQHYGIGYELGLGRVRGQRAAAGES